MPNTVFYKQNFSMQNDIQTKVWYATFYATAIAIAYTICLLMLAKDKVVVYTCCVIHYIIFFYFSPLEFLRTSVTSASSIQNTSHSSSTHVYFVSL